MAASAFDVEIERFIKPIRGLYKEYVTTIDEFMDKNEEMMEDRIIISDSIRDGFLVYEMFGDGEEGELVREKVQTWICDNRMDVTNAVSTTLRAKKVTFGDWFRSSEENCSPDELIVYCLSKMSRRHTVIFNKSFCWSTLCNSISYTDSEIVERSTVLLIYVGVSKYAIIQSKPKIPHDIGKPSNTKKVGKTKKKTTPKKRTCRSNTRKTAPVTNNPIGVRPTRSIGRTLSEQRHDRYGIGIASTTTNSRTRQKKVDYLKLNDGLEEPPETVKSPRPKRRRTYLPLRSGPSSRRQKAQKIVTSSPAQVLPIAPPHQKTVGDLDDNNDRDTEISGVQLLEADINIPTQNCENTSVNVESEISGVQVPEEDLQDVSGVQPSISGVHDVLLTSMPDTLGTDTCKESSQLAEKLNTEPSLTRQDNTDTLPDLVVNSDIVDSALSLTLPELNRLPPIGEIPPDHIFNGATTEEEFDAVDALLSLSTIRTNTSEDIDDNSTLMPVGGESHFVDVHLVRVELDQVTVNSAIAQIVDKEQNTPLIFLDKNDASAPIKVSSDIEDASLEMTVEQDDSNEQDLADIYNADTEVDDSENEQPKKGYVKLTTHGIKKKSASEGRSYRCTVCGKTKRSAQRLNAHHRRKHSAQMCGVCGKIFELASSLTHHMYSHDERRYHCNKCSFHSHFDSELKKHKITHHTNPQHQCMHRNCGHWFMRKADLVLHVETHKKNIIKCDICDHTTTLPKYMKEHMKSHSNVLPYQCDICNKRFLWRSGVRAHKQKEHAAPKK